MSKPNTKTRGPRMCYYHCEECNAVAEAPLSDVKQVGSPVCPGECGNEDLTEITKREYDRLVAHKWKVHKGDRFITARELDLRSTGGPLIPKGTGGVIVHIRRTGELWVNIDDFGHRHLGREDLIRA